MPARSEIEHDDQQIALREAGIEGHQVAQAADEQQRADDQHQRQRHLRDHQHAPQPEALAACRSRPRLPAFIAAPGAVAVARSAGARPKSRQVDERQQPR